MGQRLQAVFSTCTSACVVIMLLPALIGGVSCEGNVLCSVLVHGQHNRSGTSKRMTTALLGSFVWLLLRYAGGWLMGPSC